MLPRLSGAVERSEIRERQTVRWLGLQAESSGCRRILVHRRRHRPTSGTYASPVRAHLPSRESLMDEPFPNGSSQTAAADVVDKHQPSHPNRPCPLRDLVVGRVRDEQPSLHLHVRAGARLRELVNMVFQNPDDDVAALLRVCPFPRDALRASEGEFVLRARNRFHARSAVRVATAPRCDPASGGTPRPRPADVAREETSRGHSTIAPRHRTDGRSPTAPARLRGRRATTPTRRWRTRLRQTGRAGSHDWSEPRGWRRVR